MLPNYTLIVCKFRYHYISDFVWSLSDSSGRESFSVTKKPKLAALKIRSVAYGLKTISVDINLSNWTYV